MHFFLPILALSIGCLLAAPVQAKPAEDLAAKIARLCTSEAHLNDAKSALLSGDSTLQKQAARFLLICNTIAIGRAEDAAYNAVSIKSANDRLFDAFSTESAIDRLYIERDQLCAAGGDFYCDASTRPLKI